MNSVRNLLPNFNSPFSTACFLPIGLFLTQTKSLSLHLILMSTFLLGNKESGRPGLPCVLTQASQAQTTAGKPIPSFLWSVMCCLVFCHPSCRVCPKTFLLWRPDESVRVYPTALPSPFSFLDPSYNVGSSPLAFHHPWRSGFMKNHSYQPCSCKWWSFPHTRLDISLSPWPDVLFIYLCFSLGS